MARPNQTDSGGWRLPISQQMPNATARQPNSTPISNGTPGWPRSWTSLSMSIMDAYRVFAVERRRRFGGFTSTWACASR